MDRGERRHRTERIIDRRVRTRVFEAGGRLYTAAPMETWRKRFLYRVTVGGRKYWTFHEWLAKPGIFRKDNGAHGCCGVCEQEENLKKGEPTLAWELEQLCEDERQGVNRALPVLLRHGSAIGCERRRGPPIESWREATSARRCSGMTRTAGSRSAEPVSGAVWPAGASLPLVKGNPVSYSGLRGSTRAVRERG